MQESSLILQDNELLSSGDKNQTGMNSKFLLAPKTFCQFGKRC